MKTVRKNISKAGRCAVCLLMCMVLCALQAGAVGDAAPGWKFKYEVQDDNTAKIIACQGNKEELEIPAELDGYPVTAIGDGVFQLKQKIASVTIPEGVISIGAKAFSSCDGIKKIKLPKSLKSIGNRAFSNCKGLKELVLPEGLEVIMENPFALCDNLTDVSFSGSNKIYEVRDGALINKEEARLVAFLHQTEDGSYVVPEDIRIIGNSAFVECKELTAVKLPEGLEAVEESAFNRCVNLESLELPATLRRAENRAFANCEKLVQVKLPDSLTEMPGNAFMGCSHLSMIGLSPNNSRLEMVEGVLFDNEEKRLICYPCAATGKEYAVPEGTEIIGVSSFENCKYPVHITLPDTIKTIGDFAFSNCYALEQIDVPDTVGEIGIWAFESCINLKRFTVPSGPDNDRRQCVHGLQEPEEHRAAGQPDVHRRGRLQRLRLAGRDRDSRRGDLGRDPRVPGLHQPGQRQPAGRDLHYSGRPVRILHRPENRQYSRTGQGDRQQRLLRMRAAGKPFDSGKREDHRRTGFQRLRDDHVHHAAQEREDDPPPRF